MRMKESPTPQGRARCPRNRSRCPGLRSSHDAAPAPGRFGHVRGSWNRLQQRRHQLFATDDNFNLRQAEAARAEVERQNDRLRRSERELRELIETIPEMAWTAAPDGAATFVNGRWSEYTGLSLEGTVGLGWKFAV